MNSKFIVALMFILVLPLISAIETYQVNKPIDLKFTCTLNNAIPSSAATYNITISQINGTIIVDNKLATARGQGAFNYTVNFPVIGIYKVESFCYDGTFSYSNSENIEITPNGTALTTSQGIIYLIFLIGLTGIFFLCFFYAVKIPWKHQRDEEGYVIGINDLKYLKLFLIVTCYLILMFASGLLTKITADYIPEIGVSGFFEWMYWILLSAVYPLIVCSLILSLIIWISNKKFQKALERGLPIS